MARGRPLVGSTELTEGLREFADIVWRKFDKTPPVHAKLI